MKAELLNRILIAIIVALVLVIACGTLIVKCTPPRQIGTHTLIATGKAVNLAEPAPTADTAYFELGTIRASTNDDEDENSPGIVMVITPWLAYPSADSVFYEELARKKGAIKGIIQYYFSQRTKEQILSESETVIINNLLSHINQTLSLGKISDIYFTDYLFLE